MNNKQILNLGCGNEVYGTVRIDFVQTEATNLVWDLNESFPFTENFFDEIYSKSVLEHIGNIKQLLDECHLALKKGGKFWFRTDNASYIPFLIKDHQSYLDGIYSYNKSNDDFHYYLFKKEHLLNLFNKFSDLEVTYTCPSKKLFFLPKKYKCMHIEIRGKK